MEEISDEFSQTGSPPPGARCFRIGCVRVRAEGEPGWTWTPGDSPRCPAHSEIQCAGHHTPVSHSSPESFSFALTARDKHQGLHNFFMLGACFLDWVILKCSDCSRHFRSEDGSMYDITRIMCRCCANVTCDQDDDPYMRVED